MRAAVQLAKHFGAEVTRVSDPSHRALVKLWATPTTGKSRIDGTDMSRTESFGFLKTLVEAGRKRGQVFITLEPHHGQ